MHAAMIAGLKAQRERIAAREPWRTLPPGAGRKISDATDPLRRAAVLIARAQQREKSSQR